MLPVGVGTGDAIGPIVHFHGLFDLKSMTLNRKGIEPDKLVPSTRRVCTMHQMDINALTVVLGFVNSAIALEIDWRLVMGAAIVSRRWAPLAIILVQGPVGSRQELFGPSSAYLQVVASNIHPFGRRQDRVQRRIGIVLVRELIQILTQRWYQADKEQKGDKAQHGQDRKRRHVKKPCTMSRPPMNESRRSVGAVETVTVHQNSAPILGSEVAPMR